MYFGFVERSPGPSTQPIQGRAASNADFGWNAGSPFKNCSSRPHDVGFALATPFRGPVELGVKSGGNFNDRVFMVYAPVIRDQPVS